MQWDHLDVRIYGPRNFPLGQARVPEEVLKELPRLLEHAQRLNPAYSPESLMRWVVKSGIRAVKTSLQQDRIESNPSF